MPNYIIKAIFTRYELLHYYILINTGRNKILNSLILNYIYSITFNVINRVFILMS